MKTLNLFCFVVCVVCICVSVVVGLLMVWTAGRQERETLWRLLITSLIVCGGSAATLSVSKTFARGK